MTVQWFPGHMAKALRLIEAQLKQVDCVIECRDARAPLSTRNPVLDRKLGDKPRLIILTKKDLAEPNQSKQWMNQLEAEGNIVVLVDSLQDNLKKVLVPKIEECLIPKREREKKRGMKRRKDRALIVGVPNVGKSTIINQLASKKVASVENRPGVTQALKLIQINQNLELVDTPGVLWPKFESKEMGLHCALIGSVKHTGYNLEQVVNYAYDTLHNRFGDVESHVFFNQIASDKGLLSSGGDIEMEHVQRLFLQDIQNGKYGLITWDRL
ncbi:ribosome biogenesis GTPase YlqF [Erysipelothrix urinaevulpis]|uniref:ribosome biogenesis GTPase YlqF n=1 Tax=Erysipelothrix urinaevulpis TaxID=2683717 RepID=UPI001F02ACE5|nr:ribosome biogenesis GTPase YlqF [Erysipelothrix urinaevulpis]